MGGGTVMQRFIGYRPSPPDDYRDRGVANPPDVPQYEGVVFGDGTVVCRWLTQFRSHSIWMSWNDFYQVHGHPEYGTVIKWLDGASAKETLRDQAIKADLAAALGQTTAYIERDSAPDGAP